MVVWSEGHGSLLSGFCCISVHAPGEFVYRYACTTVCAHSSVRPWSVQGLAVLLEPAVTVTTPVFLRSQELERQELCKMKFAEQSCPIFSLLLYFCGSPPCGDPFFLCFQIPKRLRREED